MSNTDAMRPHLDKLQTRGLIVGVLGLVACGVGFGLDHDQFWRSYLLGYIYWFCLAIGSLGLLMLHHMVGGQWGVAIRRGLEAGTRTIPLMFVLLLPILFLGSHSLYEWTHAEVVAKDPILQHKSVYLNMTGVIVRAVIYFAIWILLSTLLNKYSQEQESAGYWAVRPKLQRVSAPGILIYGLAVTFAVVDWVMSLEPHWFSTVYGAMFLVGQGLVTFAFMIVLMRNLTDQEPLKDQDKVNNFHDLGTLMFAFTMLWAYISFSQFIIIWSANLPEEITWYIRRMNGGWGYIAAGLLIFHFVAPFLLLLQRRVKRKKALVATVATWMLLMRLVDLAWVILPAFGHSDGPMPKPHLSLHWMNIAAPVAIGGIWFWYFTLQLKKRSLEPLQVS